MEPQELKEYQYVVNNTVTTALLTPKMAERLGAKPVGDDEAAKVGGYSSQQNQAVLSASGMSGAIVGGEAVEPTRPQQKGIDGKGRTASMRAGTDEADNTEAGASAEPINALGKTRKAQDK